MKANLILRSVLKGNQNLKIIDFIYYRRRGGASEKLEIQGLRGKVIVHYVPGNSGGFLRLKKMKRSTNKDRQARIIEDSLFEFLEPTYLFYLKKRPDGNYEPLLGQSDPIYSVKELTISEAN